jgi:hypothetical protein
MRINVLRPHRSSQLEELEPLRGPRVKPIPEPLAISVPVSENMGMSEN